MPDRPPSKVSDRLLELLSAMLADGSIIEDGKAQDPDAPLAAADRPGGIVTGFTCYLQYVDPDGEPSWSMLYMPGQRTVDTAGQVWHLHAVIDEQLRRTVWYHDDER